MRSIISRWFMFGLLLGWAVAHASVFAQGTSTSPAAPAGGQVGGGQGGGVAGSSGVAQPAVQPGGAVKVGGMSIEKIRQGLDKNVTIDFTGQSLADVLNHFRDRTGLAINVDQMVLMNMGLLNGEIPMAQIEVKAKDEKAGVVLRRLLGNHRLNYVILEDSLLITSEEMAVLRQMRQRVNVNVDEVPLSKAVREMAKKHGINLVIDRKVKEQADTAVSLQLDNTGVETAFRLLAEMASLKAVRMGNVMFITSEEKAKKIREEEPHQFDNPLNPNIPGGIPPIAIGGFGGGFGGVMRGNVAPGVAVPFGPDGVPVPPPGIDLPPARDLPAVPQDDVPRPAKKVIDIRNAPVPQPPPPPPSATALGERPAAPAQPVQRDR